MIAEVVVSINNFNVDKPFSYLIPQSLLNRAGIGYRVIVPFGRNNKPVEGFIIDIKKVASCSYELKNILNLPDETPIINQDLMALAKWMQEKYYSTLSECIKCIIPTGISIKSENFYYVNSFKECELKGFEKSIYDLLTKNSPLTKKAIFENIPGAKDSHINAMIKRNLIIKNMTTIKKDLITFERFVYLNKDTSKNTLTPPDKSKQYLVYRYLQENGPKSIKEIREALRISISPINSLVRNGMAYFKMLEVRRNAFEVLNEKSQLHDLTDEQQSALDTILSEIKNKYKKPILLHGVTGSGKTEVYLKAIEKIIKHGKQGIVLVPEISLTPQTVERFKNRFPGIVSVTHSRMSNKERYEQWRNAAEGKTRIMIGPRSALFTPFNNLGIIIIDEEHENTYKSETTPKYDARFAAIKRAELTGALVILGSATPSMDSYYKAQENKYILKKMKKRINLNMPVVDIIDMRKELLSGNRSIFSSRLIEGISNNLNSGMQTILFLNRRGHSTFVSCRQCGFVVKCDDCSVNFTYHIYNDSLFCHYCGASAKSPKNCPQCGSKYIKYFGVGTQKIEEEVKKLFPSANILRMDMDTTSKKGSHENILSAFRNGRADILIGTQMIAKGLDFPRVTLVGVVAADLSLNSGDYRCGENTFALLTQVSGRSGRADYKGSVIIQTYNPENYSIVFSRTGDYEAFYEYELAYRRQMDYPPFSHVFFVLLAGPSEKNVIISLNRLCDIMNIYNKDDYFELIGPSPAVISKLKGQYRWRLIIKAVDEDKLRNFVLYCIDKLRNAGDLTDIELNLTIDPAVNI